MPKTGVRPSSSRRVPISAASGSGSPGPGREQDAPVPRERVGVDVVRVDRDARPRRRDAPQDGALDAVVDDRDVDVALGEDVRLRAGDAGDERAARHRGLLADGGERLLDRGAVRDRGGPHRAAVAQVQDERAGVDPREGDDAALVQPVRPRRPARLAHDDGAGVRARGLVASARHAVVADHRRREADDLLREARVGGDLLVAGHAGREDRLAEGEALGRDRGAAEDGPVLQHQEAARAHARSGTGKAGTSAPGSAPSSLRLMPRTLAARRRSSPPASPAAARRAATS